MNSTVKLIFPRCQRLTAIMLFACTITTYTLPSAAASRAETTSLRYEFSVRALKTAELPPNRSDEWMHFFSQGVASGLLGLAAPPMYASGLVVGGIILAPGALILSSMEQHMWERMVGALKTSEFEQSLLRATKARAGSTLATTTPSSAADSVNVEMVINAYGLVSQGPERLCFIASMDMIASRAGEQWLRDRLIISTHERSPDAPPPQCASQESMADNEGHLVRNTAAIYAEVLAAMVIHRLLTRQNQ